MKKLIAVLSILLFVGCAGKISTPINEGIVKQIKHEQMLKLANSFWNEQSKFVHLHIFQMTGIEVLVNLKDITFVGDYDLAVFSIVITTIDHEHIAEGWLISGKNLNTGGFEVVQVFFRIPPTI